MAKLFTATPFIITNPTAGQLIQRNLQLTDGIQLNAATGTQLIQMDMLDLETLPEYPFHVAVAATTNGATVDLKYVLNDVIQAQIELPVPANTKVLYTITTSTHPDGTLKLNSAISVAVLIQPYTA